MKARVQGTFQPQPLSIRQVLSTSFARLISLESNMLACLTNGVFNGSHHQFGLTSKPGFELHRNRHIRRWNEGKLAKLTKANKPNKNDRMFFTSNTFHF